MPTSLSIKSGWQDSNLRFRAPKARRFAATLHPVVLSSQNGRNRTADLLAPSQARYQASLRSVFSDPYESRTRLPALKGRCPRTDRLAGPSRRIFSTQLTHWACAHLSRSGSGGARIRVCGFSGRRYTISATDPQKNKKKARCRYDTGLSVFFGNMSGQVSHAQWIIGERIRRATGEPFFRYPSLCDT